MSERRGHSVPPAPAGDEHRPLLGVSIGSFADGTPSAQELLRFPTVVEEAGYASVWTGDHIMTRAPCLDALTLLGLFAARSQRLAIGISVAVLPLRHPVLLAKAVMTVDYLSGGRIILGAGIGGDNPAEFAAVGASVVDRRVVSEEILTVLPHLLRGEAVTHRGKRISLQGVQLRPPAPGSVPIWVGGRGERSLRRAVRLGTGWLPYLTTPQQYQDALTAVFGETGQPPSGFTLAASVFVYVTNTPRQAVSAVGGHLGRTFGQPFEHLVDRYCIIGPADHCANRLSEFVRLGVSHFVLNFPCPWSELTGQLERFASVGLEMPGVRHA